METCGCYETAAQADREHHCAVCDRIRSDSSILIEDKSLENTAAYAGNEIQGCLGANRSVKHSSI